MSAGARSPGTAIAGLGITEVGKIFGRSATHFAIDTPGALFVGVVRPTGWCVRAEVRVVPLVIPAHFKLPSCAGGG